MEGQLTAEDRDRMFHRDVVIRFGSFEVDMRERELRKFGARVKLQQQPFHILAMLVEHPGQIVTREAIQSELWPGSVHVDFENAINSSIRKLRDALGDKAESPRFIETLSRRGYRFIAPVTVVRNTSTPLMGEQSRPVRAPKLTRLAVYALASAAVLLALWAVRPGREADTDRAYFKASPFTTYPGEEIEPSFSPDSTRVAFAWNSPHQDNFDIYVKRIDAVEPVRLTTSPAADRGPAWSPDGEWIAFLRELNEGESALMLMPAMGGPETELTRVRIAWVHAWAVPGRYLTWAGDSKSLFLLDGGFPDPTRYSIINVSIESRERRSVHSPKNGTNGPSALAVSPDGQSLIYTLGRPRKVYLMPLSGNVLSGEETLIFNGSPGRHPCGVDWSPDSKDIIYSTCGSGVWRRARSGFGKPVLLPGLEDASRDLAVSRQGHRLVYSEGAEDQSIWGLQLTGNSPPEPTPFVASTRNETSVAFSPDAERIAFESDRSGTNQIWVCRRDGSNPVQLTKSASAPSGSPQWSPDGRTIAFARVAESGNSEICTVTSNGGEPRALVTGPSNNTAPGWSRDGLSIYFTSGKTGRPEIWKSPSTGGIPVQVTRSGGSDSQESVDGAELYYKKVLGRTGALYKAPVAGGEEVQVLESVYQGNFAVGTDGIYYVNRGGKDAEIRFLAFGTKRDKKLASLFARLPGFALAPDGKSLLFTQVDSIASDLMLVENFP